MDTLAEDFLAWAGDAGRSVEEKFGVVLLVEGVYQRFAWAAGLPFVNFEEQRKVREARLFNPAYAAEVPRWKLEFAAGKLGEVRELSIGDYTDDRPLRDLSFLRFVPGLEGLRIGSLDREDLAGLRHVPGLRKFSLRSPEVEDYAELAGCRGLRELDVHTSHPWPMLAGLDGLPELVNLHWHGPVSALATVGTLPALRYLQTGGNFYHTYGANPVRDLHALPEMPLLQHLWGGWFHRLDGVERFPKLSFLMVMTFAKGLGRLAALEQLTHLRVSAPNLTGLEEVARIRGLLQFALYSERPQDWGVLLESESLREVFHFIDYKTEADLGMLRLVLPDYADFFAAPEPRPLEPLRLITGGSVEEKGMTAVAPPTEYPEGPDGWDGNLGMRETEGRWVATRVREALDWAGFLRMQGVRCGVWKAGAYDIFSSPPTPRSHRTIMVNLLRTEAIARVREIVECLRRALAGFRYRWQIYVHMEVQPDADRWDESWRNVSEETAAKQEEEDERYREYQQKQKRILLDDELRLRMMKELGEDLSGFKPSPRPARPDDPYNAPEPEEKKPDDDGPGGAAECDPDTEAKDEHWLPPVSITDPNAVWHDLNCMFEFDEEAIYIHVKNHGLEHIRDLFDLP